MPEKILVINDEPDFLELMKVRLEKHGYNVVTAYNGSEALAKVDRERPDLILLDIIMPQMDGYTTLKELKNRDLNKTIPVIVLTAKMDMKDLFKVEGITDYITKPFDDEELLLRIKRALDSNRNE